MIFFLKGCKVGGGWGSQAESQLLPTFTASPRKKTNKKDSVPKPTTLVPKSVSLDRGRGGRGVSVSLTIGVSPLIKQLLMAPSLVVQGALAKCHQAPMKGRETFRVLTCRTPTPPRVWQGWRHSAGSSPRCPRRWCSGCPSRAEARSTCPEPTSKLRRAERCSEPSSPPTGRGEGGGRGRRRRRCGKGREKADLVANPETEPVLAKPLRSRKWRSRQLQPQGSRGEGLGRPPLWNRIWARSAETVDDPEGYRLAGEPLAQAV